LLGGWLGSGLAVALDDSVLRWVVAVYCLVAAWQIGFGTTRAPADGSEVAPPRGWPMTVAGGGIGAMSAVVGIGGGSMTVPLLVWRGVRPVRAVGTSSACGVAIAISSAAGYALHAPPGALPGHAIGYVYLPAALGVAMASVLAAPLGTRLAHAISGQALRKVFARFLLVVGVSGGLSGCAGSGAAAGGDDGGNAFVLALAPGGVVRMGQAPARLRLAGVVAPGRAGVGGVHGLAAVAHHFAGLAGTSGGVAVQADSA